MLWEFEGIEILKEVTFGAYARSTGNPCQAKAMTNCRCKNHCVMSIGPKTLEGRQTIAQATRKRMVSEGCVRVLEGFYRWLDGGCREILSMLARAVKSVRGRKQLIEKIHKLKIIIVF
jgi:hypothetical protein